MNNKFVFVSPMFNASETLSRMLHSIFGQSYDDWKLILVDDVSDVSHTEMCRDILQKFESIAPGKVETIWNEKKEWEVANVLKGISRCEDGDIVCRIDADDWLVDLDCLAIMNYAYVNSGCDIAWTAHRWSFSDKNISGPMANDADPYKHPWVSSHLKTFRKSLLNNVKDENYRGEEGTYIRRAGDQAIYLPALKNSKNRLFIPRVMYHYTIKDIPETYQTDDARFQRDEAVFLRKRGYVE